MSSKISDVSDWLDRIGMADFAEVFADNGIDFDLLFELTSQDLLEVGVMRLADRKVILKEIRLLTVDRARNSVQRRVLSVFFCDMVGSTARSTEIDPEEFRSEMRMYQDAVVAAVNRHGGFVARFLGDGVLAYFGWPHADEDQASQAVRAGLDAIRIVGDLKLEAGFQAQCRVGIATGRVVVGGQRDLDSAFGETPNLAARLQSLANTDQIVIDLATRGAIGSRFVIDYLEKTTLKGYEQPVSAWSVVKERKYLDRFDSRGGSSSVFVGRSAELETMRDAWAKTLSGRGQALLLRGDPGIGKSRLVKQFCETHLPEGTKIQQYQCSSHHTNSAFYPVIQQTEEATGIDALRDSDADKLEKIKLYFYPSIANNPQSIKLLAELFINSGVSSAAPDDLTPAERRSQTVEILIEHSVQKAGGGALVFVIEDLHWMDPSSKVLLEFIVGKLETSPILILITSRLSSELSLGEPGRFSELQIPRLSASNIEQVTRSVDPAGLLSAGNIQNIVSRADGVPLFAEEIARAALESDSRGEVIDLPESVEASLAARLDNLGEAKRAIQLASVIGRNFELPELQALATVEDSALLAALGAAIASGLVEEVQTSSDRAFRFAHALVQDVAYNGLLNHQRKAFHKRLAMDVYDENVKQREPELIALHFTHAGEVALAIEYWKRAADRSAAASANAESIAHFQQGLRLVSQLPASEQRDELEFGLLVGMAMPLIVEKGYTSRDLERCITDALTISKRVKHSPDIYSLLFSQWGFKLTVGMMEDSRKIAYQFSDLAVQQNDEIAKYARYRMLGATHMCLGELDRAKAELSMLVDNYEPEQHRELQSVYGVDLRVAGHCFLSEVLWLLGHVEEAKESAANALHEAREMEHLHSHAISLHFCALVAFLNRDRDLVREYIGEMMALASKQAIGAWPTLGRAMEAWATMNEENFDEKLGGLIEGVSAASQLGVAMFIPFFYCRIAEELLSVGRLDEAREYMGSAETLMKRTDETVYKGELMRLQAQLRCLESNSTGAYQLFSDGLAYARSQGARSVELRVANTYADNLLKRGDCTKAREILEPVLSQFDQAVSSHDLTSAWALLGEIEAASCTSQR